MDDDKLLTFEQAADRLGLRPVTVRMWASKGKIARVKMGRSVRIPESEVLRLGRDGLDISGCRQDRIDRLLQEQAEIIRLLREIAARR